MNRTLLLGALLLLAVSMNASPAQKGARDQTDARAAAPQASTQKAEGADACATESSSSKKANASMQTEDLSCWECYYAYYAGPIPSRFIEDSDLKFELCKINHCQ